MKRQTIKILTIGLKWGALDARQDLRQPGHDFRGVIADSRWAPLVAPEQGRKAYGFGTYSGPKRHMDGKRSSASRTARETPPIPRKTEDSSIEDPSQRSGIELGDTLDFDALADRALAASWYKQFEEGR